MHPRLLVASFGAWAWAYLTLEAAGQVYMASRPMDCLPSYEDRIVRTARSKIHCSALCRSLLCLVFSYSDGVCDMRGVGLEDPADTRLYTKFSLPSLSPLQEVSRGKNVSSTPELYPWYIPENAIDGDNTTIYHGYNNIQHPWWMIDLQAPTYVFIVDIIPRQNSFEYRFHDIEVRVGVTPPIDDNFSLWPLLGFYKGPYELSQGVIRFANSTGICGQYVAVQRVSSDVDQLQLAEVLVFAKTILI
nr:uncharacterized protein LOC113807542 [Penaeus vannamei]